MPFLDWRPRGDVRHRLALPGVFPMTDEPAGGGARSARVGQQGERAHVAGLLDRHGRAFETPAQMRQRLFAPGAQAERVQWLDMLQECMRRGDVDAADALFDEVVGLPTFQRDNEGGVFFQELGSVPIPRSDAVAPQPSGLWYMLPVMRALRLELGDVMFDLGSGIGKAAILFAGFTPVTRAVGIELAQPYVDFANERAAVLDLYPRAQFYHSDCVQVDWSSANVFYIYNPFCMAEGSDVMERVATNLIQLGQWKELKIAAKGPICHALSRPDAGFVGKQLPDTLNIWSVFATRGSPLAERIEAEQSAAAATRRVFVDAQSRAVPALTGSAQATPGGGPDAEQACAALGLPGPEVMDEFRSRDWAEAVNRQIDAEPVRPLAFSGFLQACSYVALLPGVSRLQEAVARERDSIGPSATAYMVSASSEARGAIERAIEALRTAALLALRWPDTVPDAALEAAFGNSSTCRALKERIGAACPPGKQMPALYPVPQEALSYLYDATALVRAAASPDRNATDRFAQTGGYAGCWLPADGSDAVPKWVGGHADALGLAFTDWVAQLDSSQRVLIGGANGQELVRSWTDPTELDRWLPQPAALPELVLSEPGAGLPSADGKGRFDAIVWRSDSDIPLHRLLLEAAQLLRPGGLLFFDAHGEGAVYDAPDGVALSMADLFGEHVDGLSLRHTRISPDALIFGEWRYGSRTAYLAERTGETPRVPDLLPVVDPSSNVTRYMIADGRAGRAAGVKL